MLSVNGHGPETEAMTLDIAGKGVALALLLALPAGAWPFTLGAHGGQLFRIRTFTSEVPSATRTEGDFARVGVILPPRSKVVRVEAYMDSEDHGDSTTAWSECDLASGRCEIGDGRVERLRRYDRENETVITADFWNTHPDALRYAKLKVVFLPVGSARNVQRPEECRLRVRCGFGGWMNANFLGEQAPAREPAPDDDDG